MTDSTSIESSTNATVTVSASLLQSGRYDSTCVATTFSTSDDFAVELLIHDDVSTDGTREIVDGICQPTPWSGDRSFTEQNQYSQGVNVEPPKYKLLENTSLC